jgi:antirestriction protein ArdC
MNSQELRESVNQKLIEALSNNVLPWRRPWSGGGNGGRHRNFATGRPYSGVNPLLLEMHCLKHGLESNRWATFRQWENIGCMVKKRPADVRAGGWGCTVVFCKPVKKTVMDKVTGEDDENRYFILRSFTVFNADQVSGEAVEKLKATSHQQPVNGNAYPAVEELISATGAEINHGGDRAFYALPQPAGSWPNHKSGDNITMPERSRFISPERYLETCLHELAHWAEVRVGWDRRLHGYSMGELVAEISACYIASALGMPITLEEHAAYLKSWCDGMKDSASFIFRACSMASKATDYLLSFVRPEEAEGSEEAEDSAVLVTA